MKPVLELSPNNNFTAWENGGWHSQKLIGRGQLVAGMNGEKLRVLYDRKPSANNTKHALLPADSGQIVTSVYYRQNGDRVTNYLEINRIESLFTETEMPPATEGEEHLGEVEPIIVPRCTIQPLWLLRSTLRARDLKGQKPYKLLDRMPEIEGVPNARELMELTIKKALTHNIDQYIFWGIERERDERDIERAARHARIARGLPEDYEDPEDD